MKFHKHNEGVLGIAAEDKSIILFDTKANKQVARVPDAHEDELFSIDFNAKNEFLYITGSKDCYIGLWDIRKPEQKIHTFESHSQPVLL